MNPTRSRHQSTSISNNGIKPNNTTQHKSLLSKKANTQPAKRGNGESNQQRQNKICKLPFSPDNQTQQTKKYKALMETIVRHNESEHQKKKTKPQPMATKLSHHPPSRQS